MDPEKENNVTEDPVVTSADDETEDNSFYIETEPLIDVESPKAKAVQIILGILSGIGVIAAMFLPLFTNCTDNPFFQILFALVFAAIIIVERLLQKKFRCRFYIFARAWIFSLIACIVAAIIYGAATGAIFA